MTKLISAISIIIFGVSICYATDPVLIESQLERITAEIEAQIEQIKRARDITDSKMGLAQIRIEQQLLQSEQELQAQIEKLARYQEKLSAQIVQADSAMKRMRKDWLQALAATKLKVREQMRQTRAMLDRFKQWKRGAGAYGAPTAGISSAAKLLGAASRGVGANGGPASSLSLDEIEAKISGLNSGSSTGCAGGGSNCPGGSAQPQGTTVSTPSPST